MVDITISPYKYITLDYLEEYIEEYPSNFSVTDQNGNSIDESKYKGSIVNRKRKIFEPTGTGEYTIEYNGNKINVSVYDIIDNFEDGDISEYSGDTGNYSVVSNRSYNGSNALYNGGNNDNIYSKGNLNISPQPGDIFQIRTYHGDDEAGSSFGFGFNGSGDGNYAGYHAGIDKWFITNTDDGPDNGGYISDSNPESGQWWKWIVKWYKDKTADFTVYDENGNVIAGPMSYNADKYTDKGIWFSSAHQSGNHDHWWDNYKIIGSTES